MQYHANERSFENLQWAVDNGEFDTSDGSTICDYYRDFRWQYHSHGVQVSFVWLLGSSYGSSFYWDVYYVSHNFSYIFTGNQAPLNQAFDVGCHVVQHVTTTIFGVVNNVVGSVDEWTPHYSSAQALLPSTVSFPYSGYSPDWDVQLYRSNGRVFILSPIKPAEFFSLVGYDTREGVYINWADKGLAQFHSVCEPLVSKCVAGNAVSSIDAIDSHFGLISRADHIEFAVELSDVLGPLDLVKAAWLMAVRKDARSLKGLLDLLANAELTYKFGIAPNVDDAKEVAKNLRKLLRKMNDPTLFGPNTIYGKRTYILESNEIPGFTKTFVTCRSKIRVSSNADTLLPLILPPRSWGLLPSLSSAWNLIPYSFAVDWITRSGASLRILEDQTLLFMLNIDYSVHSLNISYPFSDEDETDYNFASVGSGSNSAGYRYYVRYVLGRRVPIIGPTILPIIGNLSVPDLGIVGALAYKRL
jgi:hypothetical protein